MLVSWTKFWVAGALAVEPLARRAGFAGGGKCGGSGAPRPVLTGSGRGVREAGAAPLPASGLDEEERGVGAGFQRRGGAVDRAREGREADARSGWATWVSAATSGAEAAKKGDIAGARAACKSCHDTWRTTYRQQFRLRPIPR